MAATRGSNELELPGRLHPVLALLAFLPIMTIILIGLGIAVETTPPIGLLALFAVVIVSCLGLMYNAIQTISGGTIVLEVDGLRVRRLLREDTYPWSTLEACKVTPATGTFGDDALAETDERVGLGLFLKGSEREREHDLDADVVLCAGDRINIQPLMQLAAKIETARKKASTPQRRPVGRPLAAGARAQFQQRPNSQRSGRAPADPVAAFRQKSASDT